MDILTNLAPIFGTIATGLVLWGIVQGMIKGEQAGRTLQKLGIGCIVVAFAFFPLQFRDLGMIVIKFVKSIGNSLM
jgi:uncharacterized membrane protein